MGIKWKILKEWKYGNKYKPFWFMKSMNETVLIQADILPCYCPCPILSKNKDKICSLCNGYIKDLVKLEKKKKSKTI